jgi:cyclic beta-1,2-glucan synthetase
VVEGYGVLQPRVSFHLTAATHSRFAALLASSGGIDPYSTAASDTYMDLFGIGSFTGKGIYDVDAFEAATGHAFPENLILSHDLVEGNFARCGLLSDTELFDDFPARYHAYARREHRWVRGDWQILPWIGRRVPTPRGRAPNPCRSWSAGRSSTTCGGAWSRPPWSCCWPSAGRSLPGSPWLWTLAALAVPALPLLQLVIGTLSGRVRSRSLEGLKRWRDSVPAAAGQVLLSIVFLADRARVLVDAIARTLVRMRSRGATSWSGRPPRRPRGGWGPASGTFIESMWPAPALALALGAAVAAVRPGALGPAAPILAAWFFSPVVAFWVSKPRPVVVSP